VPEFIHLRIFGSLVLRPTRRSSLTAVKVVVVVEAQVERELRPIQLFGFEIYKEN
jgi:hypothetical protein